MPIFGSRMPSVLGAMLVAGVLAGCAAPQYEPPTDFSGFWELHGDFDSVTRPENNVDNLTEEAKQNLAEFRERFPEGESNWPMDLCVMHGMPWTMLTRARTYATEIYQTKDRIVLHHEGFDTVRQIHLDKTEMPPYFGPSNQGYSIGHWEGDELVIVTEGVLGMNEYSDLQRSDDIKIIERWRLVEGENGEELLETEFEVHDPVVYKEPGYGVKRWERMPEDTVVSGYNCNFSLWDDYVAQELMRQEEAEAANGQQ